MKRFGKRLLCVVMCLCLMVACMSGCNSNKNYGLKASEPVTLSLWHYYNGAQQQAFDAMVSQFNDTVGREKGIFVEASSQGKVSELIEKAMDSLDGKVGSEKFPDMLAAYADTAYEIESRGMAADISPYITQEEMDSYVQEYVDEGRFSEDGGVQLFPVAKSTEVFMLNESDWKPFADEKELTDADFSTWEGIVDVARQYYEYTDELTPDVPDDGKAFFGRDAMANYWIVGSMQLGTEMFSVKNGQVTYQLNEGAIRRLWDNYYVPYVNGWFGASGQFRSDDVKTGKLVACVGSTSSAMFFPNQVTQDDGSVYDIEVAVYPLPNFEGTEPYAVQQGAGMLVTKSDETHEYACTVFLKWFTQAENNLKFSLGSGYLPVTKEANDLAMVTSALADINEPETSTLYQTLTTGVTMAEEYTFYTNKAFKNGTAARDLISNSFLDALDSGAARVEALMAEGATRKEAAAQVATDDTFSQWFNQLSDDINELGAE